MVATARNTLKKKLLTSHMILAFMGLVILLLAVTTIFLVQKSSLKVIQVSQPKTELTDHLNTALQSQQLRSSELLKGDAEDIKTLRESTTTKLSPILQELQDRMESSSRENQQRFAAFAASIIELQLYQEHLIALVQERQKDSHQFLWQHQILPALASLTSPLPAKVGAQQLKAAQELPIVAVQKESLWMNLSTLGGNSDDYETLSIEKQR